MTQPILTRIMQALALTVAIAFSVCSGAAAGDPAPAATKLQSLTDAEKKAVQAVVTALANTPDLVDGLLVDSGFGKLAREIPDFADWPTLRKIDAAYKSAHDAQGKPAGNLFLARIARRIESEHSAAIRSEAHLASIFDIPDAGESIVFTRPPPEVLKSLPSEQTMKAILAIERYVDRVPGGLQGVMHGCCYADGSLDAVYETLHAAPNRLQALMTAVENGRLPPEVKARMVRLLTQVMENTSAAAYEPALARYLASIDPEAHDAPLAPVAAKQVAVNVSADTERQKLLALYKAAKSDLPAAQAAKVPAFASLALQDAASARASVEPAAVARAAPHPTGANDRKPEGAMGLPGTTSQGGPHDGGGGVSTPPNPGGPSGGGGAPANANRFRAVQDSMRGEGGSPGPFAEAAGGMPRFEFGAMRISRAGPGGVLFGNTFEAKGVAKPKKAIWVRELSPEWGHFDIVSATGEVLMTKRMHAQDAFAAWRIVTGRSDSDTVFPPLDIAHGEGVGLASVQAREASDLDGSMLVHPTLYGLELGNAAARADAIGFAMRPGAFCLHLEAANAPADMALHALKWRMADNGWYKILDAPLRIVAKGGELTVERVPIPELTPVLASSAFLDFQAIVDDKAAVNPDFTPAVPALVAAFPAFARLNAFAETFAIMRWVKQSGAEVKPPLELTPVVMRLHIRSGADGDLEADAQEHHAEQSNAERIADVEANGKGLMCLLHAVKAPETAFSALREAIDARVLIERVSILEDGIEAASDADEQEDAVSAMRQSLNRQSEGARAVLGRFATADDVIGEFLDASGREVRNQLSVADAVVRVRRDEVLRLTDRSAAIEALPDDKQEAAKEAQDALLQAIRAFIAASPGAADDAALKSLQSAKAAYVASVPLSAEAAAEARRKLAISEAEAAALSSEYEAKAKSLTAKWPPNMAKEIASLSGMHFLRQE